MTTTPDLATLAGKLSQAQRVYLDAVATSEAPYEPRHGATANWALRHSFVDSVVRLNDGREGLWRSFPEGDRWVVGIKDFLGQSLTPLGLALRNHLKDAR